MLSFFPRDVLDEILNLIESVIEGFPSYSFISNKNRIKELLHYFFTFVLDEILNLSQFLRVFLPTFPEIFLINRYLWEKQIAENPIKKFQSKL